MPPTDPLSAMADSASRYPLIGATIGAVVLGAVVVWLIVQMTRPARGTRALFTGQFRAAVVLGLLGVSMLGFSLVLEWTT